MNKNIKLFLLVLIIFSIHIIYTQEQPLQMVISNWAPYKGEDLLESGIATDITKQALLLSGYAVEIVNRPWQRALNGAIAGDYDVVPAIWTTPEREVGLHFSESILNSRIIVISLKTYPFEYTKLEDLKGETVGVGRGWGWGYPDEFLEADYFTREPAVDLEINLKKLLAGRFNIVVDEEFAIRYLVSTKFPEFIDKIQYSTVSLIESPLLVAFSRKLPDYEEITKDFNKALKEMHENGTYNEILKKHGVFQSDSER